MWEGFMETGVNIVLYITLLSIAIVHKCSSSDTILITFVIHIDKKRQKAPYKSYVVHVEHN